MKKQLYETIILFTLLAVLFPLPVAAQSGPVLKKGGKWRIGYFEGGPFSDYMSTMQTLLMGLYKLGWLKEYPPPRLSENLEKPFLDWLAKCNTPYLVFDPKDAYSAKWDNHLRVRMRQELLGKLKAGQLDLVIAMGTWAGLDLANNEHSVPVMVLSTSNPLYAGIIASVDDSGYDHVTARVDPKRYLRQLRMFHRIVGFKRLGVAFEDTPDGRLYSAVSEVKQISRERGFEVEFCKLVDTTADTELADRTCLECFKRLARKTDAVYVTALSAIDRQSETIVKLLRDFRIPSFSLTGSYYVSKGIMLSISSDSGYMSLGDYNSEKFGKILNGIKPRSLEQRFEDPLDIAVNMETARRIGFEVPSSILSIATEQYEK